MTDAATGPLCGLRIVDISTVVAGPFAAGLLGDYGADVIKVEMPGAGDSLRALAPHKDGTPLWWKVTNRNKKGVTLDLRKPEGRDLFAKKCTRCHGEHARGGERFPRLAGQQNTYLIRSLTRYRDRTGARMEPEMLAMTAALKDEDIKAVADYLSSLR